jgi:hypothetical protein
VSRLGFRNRFKKFSGDSVSDDFNRANSTGLGSTSVGGLPYEYYLNAATSFDVVSNTAQANPSTYSGTAYAVVDSGGSDVDLQVGVSSAGGGDALYFRVVDQSNWWRIRRCSYTYTYQYSYNCAYNCPVYTTYYCWNYDYGAIADGALGSFSGSCTHNHADSGSTYSTSSSSCPAAANYAHSHSGYWRNTVNNPCDQLANAWNHNHARTSCSQSCGTASNITSYTTCYTTCYANANATAHDTYLEKSVAGTVTQVDSVGSNPSTVRALAVGTSIEWFTNGATQGAHTSSDHQYATKHGIGRGVVSAVGTPLSGTAIDNFSLTAKDA